MSTAAPKAATKVATGNSPSNRSEFKVVNLNEVFIDPQLNSRSPELSKDGKPLASPYEGEDFDGLVQSIESKGQVLQNIGLIKTPLASMEKAGGKPYMLIAGFRRCHALMKLAADNNDPSWLENVPAMIQPASDLARCVGIQLTENIQRLDMNPMDIAMQMAYIVKETGVSQVALAQELGKDKSYVSNYIGLTKLPDEIQDKIRSGRVSFSAAREILRLPAGKGEGDYSVWLTLADLAERLTFGKFKEHIEAITEEGGEVSAEAAGDIEGTQKTVASVKVKQLTEIFVPRLVSEIAAATDEATKAKYTAWLEALNFVKLGAEDQSTELAKHFKPYLDHLESEKAAIKAAEESEHGKKLYVGSLVKAIREACYPKKVTPGMKVPLPAEALAQVQARVTHDRQENGTVVYVHQRKEKGSETPVEKSYTFQVPSVEQFMVEVGNAFQKDQNDRDENKAKRAKEKAEKAAAGGASDAEESDEDGE